MTAEYQRELLERAGTLLADKFRADFTPGETIGVLIATIGRVVAWLDYDDGTRALADLRCALDQLDQRGKNLH